jgi:hypothetical protein
MKALRVFGAGAASLSPAELQAQLMNDKGFVAGSFAEHKAREVEAALELAGFTVLPA